MLEASRKAREVEILDRIARQVTFTIRPVTEVISKALSHPPTGVIFKREVSDTGSHVYMPDDIAKMTRKDLKKLALDRFTWMSQTYIPYLRRFGEWRVYFLGGKFFDVVVTEPGSDGDVQYNTLEGVWSLKELR